MGNKLEKKYGLFTAICMVVGIVIGSGVFFKAQTVLTKTNGNMPLGILAWLIGGVIMLCCVLTFANMAQKYEKVNGIVDYAEAAVGSTYGYYIGWFMTTIYYPAMTSVLAWLSARYTLVFIVSVNPDFGMMIDAADGGCILGPECMALTMFYLCCAYAVNVLSPKLAGKYQTTTTVIKLIPLALMAVVGVVYGLVNGITVHNFTTAADVSALNGTCLLYTSTVHQGLLGHYADRDGKSKAGVYGGLYCPKYFHSWGGQTGYFRGAAATPPFGKNEPDPAQGDPCPGN